MDVLDILDIIERGAAVGILADQKRRKANKEAARQRGRAYVANYFATHSCADCGESDPVVLTFDHVRGTKRANVSDMVRDGPGLEIIKAEIEKCDVVCYNCHSLRTQERPGAWESLGGSDDTLLHFPRPVIAPQRMVLLDRAEVETQARIQPSR